MQELLKKWGITPFKKREDIEFYGSPNRAIKREAYEDTCNEVYIIEEVFDSEKKARLAGLFDELICKGLKVLPVLKTLKGEYILNEGLRSYQVSKYIKRKSLPRPEFVKDSWRGKEMAGFLLKLKKAKVKSSFQGVNLEDYIKEITKKLGMHQFYDFLSPLFASELKLGFCHGDFHPLNIIWGENRIKAVIDWEFCGMNYRAYDPANLIGCIGIEHPDYLLSPFVKEFVKNMRGYLVSKEIEHLAELILATRFGWLVEWYRNKDKEMQELELEYMHYLKENC
ncbi:MAG: phosphotransferase family protein, partial [Nanobdellota archaeon]